MAAFSWEVPGKQTISAYDEKYPQLLVGVDRTERHLPYVN